jgi:mycothiol synthase
VHALPEGFVVRHLTPADLPAAQALLDTCETADSGEPCVHEMDLAVVSRSVHFELEDNTWAILAADGRMAAVGWVWTPHDDDVVTADHYVRPDCRSLGFDATMLYLIEERARFYAGRREGADVVHLITWAEDRLEERCDLVRERGFEIVRQLFQMRLDLSPPPPAAVWPESLVVRPIRPDEDGERAHLASEEAFREHFLHWPTPYEEWRLVTLEREDLDPGLWLLAWDGDEVAGQVRVQRRGDEVLVEDLSVRKPWRGLGLGLALLLDVFGRLAERGYPFVRLFVDAQNSTGALDLYLRAGMRRERRFYAFEKRLD